MLPFLRTEERCWNDADAIGAPVRVGSSRNHNGIDQIVADLSLQPNIVGGLRYCLPDRNATD